MTQPVLNETMGEGVTLETLMQYDRMEVVDGVLQEKPGHGFLHALITGQIFDVLYSYVSENMPGEFFSDGLSFNLCVANSKKIYVSRIPDSCFIRADAIPEFDHSEPFPGAPTLAIEIASPAKVNRIIQPRVADYLKYGSEQVWVIYPRSQQLVQYFADDRAPKIYKQGDTLTDESLFPGLTLSVSDIFDV